MTRLTKDYSAARQYLAKVLPWPQADDEPAWIGVTYKSKGEGKKWFWSTRGAKSVAEAVGLIDWALARPSIHDIYVCMGSLRTAEVVTSKRGFKYTKAERSQEQVVGLKSLYIDLDAKGGSDSYATIDDAIVALFNFLKATRFPLPSCMVRTGGGVHVYWTLDRLLEPAEWLPLAQALVNAATKHGLKFDTGCTIDYARILRVPQTLNHKFDPAKEVELVDVSDFDYSVAKIEHVLAPYKDATRPVVSQYIENPDLFKPGPALGSSDLAAGIEAIQLPKPTLGQLAKACPFVKEACREEGANYPEPLWYETVQLAMWTVEGERAAHVMSMKHPNYSHTETEEKYDAAVEAQATKKLGWPQCRTISNAGSKPCKSCPNLNSSKSPLNFVTLQSNPAAINGIQFKTTFAGMNTILQGDIDLPDGYKRAADGIISKALVDEAGATFYVPVSSYPMINPFINTDAEGQHTLNFTTSVQVGVPKVIRAKTAVIQNLNMRGALQGVGLMMSETEVKPMGEFLVAWVKKLQQLKDAMISTEPFGWSAEGFAYGGVLYTPNGNRSAPGAEHALAAHYAPIGDLAVWFAAAKMLTDQHRPALDAILASAFAAPLVRSTGQPGLLMSIYSIKSGVGKTTAMKVAQAVWGDPSRAMQGLNDTQNSVLNKLGKLRSLPMFWDELKTEEDTKKMIVIWFAVTGGREKHRLQQNIEQREVGSWETLLMSASNESMLDHIVRQTKATTAGLHRMFEFTIEAGTQARIPISEAARMTAALNTNFGGAGQAYAQFLGTQYPRVDQEVADKMIEIGDLVSVEPDERFWAALVAVIVMGATYANELGLTSIDLPRLQEFMVAQFHGMRQLRDSQSVDMEKTINVADLLVQFLRDMRPKNTLVTDVMWRGRGKPPKGAVKTVEGPKEALLCHVAVTDHWLRISQSGLFDWLEKRQAPRHLFLEQLKALFGATRVNATLGAGTIHPSGSGFCVDIDLTHAASKLYLADIA